MKLIKGIKDINLGRMSVHLARVLLFVLGATFFTIQCQKSIAPQDIRKIEFDYIHIDASGLRRGEVAVDYEFCIPADASFLKEIKRIEPAVRLMKNSKGRIGCRENQWLCIVNTHSPNWKKKLYAIASLRYVLQLKEVVYE